jgi:DNA replication and repair protein RecF
MRKNLLGELNEYIGKTFKDIFDESHELELEIDSKFSNFTPEDIAEFYRNSLEKDLVIGHTSSGAHRDDYTFHFDGYNSYEYCSLGQQKMSFLSLLFAYIELFRYKFKTYPIVLIDDVSGELDQRRWIKLINFLENNNFQVLITTANENFKTELEKIQDAQKIFIHDGRIEIL